VALRMWTVRDPAHAVKVLAKQPRLARLHGFSVPEFRHFAEHARSLADVIATNDDQVRIWRRE